MSDNNPIQEFEKIKPQYIDLTEKEEGKYEYCDKDDRRKMADEIIKKYEEENSNRRRQRKEGEMHGFLVMPISIALFSLIFFVPFLVDFMNSIIDYLCSLFFKVI